MDVKNFENLREKIKDFLGKNNYSKMFERCFMNTIETTCKFEDDGSVFVVTGDIPAMWLRDSTAQVLQYLNFIEDDNVKSLIKGVIKRQIKYIITDTYANAFMHDANCVSEWDGRVITERCAKIIWERKFELDSLCYPLFLTAKYYEKTGDLSIFNGEFLYGYDYIMQTFRIEQKHSENSSYRFKFWNEKTFVGDNSNKKGEKGLIWCGFRPSDDRCEFNYHIPDNMFVVSSLEKMQKIFAKMGDKKRGTDCKNLIDELVPLIEKYGVKNIKDFGEIYVSETDCLGNSNTNDDANIPSLLSIPYLEYPYLDKKIYENTRRYVLSNKNKYYYSGKILKGIGSPHTPKNRVWPLSLSMQGITSNNEKEIIDCFNMLTHSTADTMLMHESIDVDDEKIYSRPWFAWANSLFAEFVIRKKDIILKNLK